jgi:hypothetical protein
MGSVSGHGSCKCHDMKKLKHEAELFKGALLAGVKYAEGRKAVEFEPTDSASQKLLYIYRLSFTTRSSSHCQKTKWLKRP